MNILVTGGNGFIGFNFINYLLKNKKVKKIINIDKDSKYSIKNSEFKKSKKYFKLKNNLSNIKYLISIMKFYEIDTVVHFAAESHVDRSILGPTYFIQNNINSTLNIVEASRLYNLDHNLKFHYISTDEIYGSNKNKIFNLNSPLNPSSPYSVSKSFGNLILKSWKKTYNFNSSSIMMVNNFGPYQNIEKLIPATIMRILFQLPILIYGDGTNLRTYIHVNDSVKAIEEIIFKKTIKDYTVSSNNFYSNNQIVKKIITILKNEYGINYDLKKIVYTNDRPGHDQEYRLSKDKKIKSQLNNNFNSDLIKTVDWYVKNRNKILNSSNKKQLKKVGFR
tara:strand:- start:864 stop:1868 length:1005 start_codon:yes stop_codon:yes gene_type:complete